MSRNKNDTNLPIECCFPNTGNTCRNLEEVLDTFRVVAAALTTDSLNLLHLTGLARRLYVLEVHFLVLAEVHDRTQEVEQT